MCWSLFQQQLLYLNKILLSCQQKVLLILFTSSLLNQQLNKYISLTYISQYYYSINYRNIEIVITLAIPGIPKKAISKPDTMLIGMNKPN